MDSAEADVVYKNRNSTMSTANSEYSVKLESEAEDIDDYDYEEEKVYEQEEAEQEQLSETEEDESGVSGIDEEDEIGQEVRVVEIRAQDSLKSLLAKYKISPTNDDELKRVFSPYRTDFLDILYSDEDVSIISYQIINYELITMNVHTF
jgi:hypothetical protein